MAIVLSLLCALGYGVSDFLGGLFAKHVTPWQVAVVGQLSSATCALAAWTVVPGSPSVSDLGYGALAGVGGGFGVAFLYRGLSTSRMGVVAPISAIGTALLPVAGGLITGERPALISVVGIVLAFPAIVLISRVPAGSEPDPTLRGGILDGALAGLGFGTLFVMLGQTGPGAGFGAVFFAQVTSILTVILTASVLGAAWLPRDRRAWRALVMGPLGATAQGAFLFATQQGLLSLVAVVSSLYPAVTVLLASVVLREHILRWQAIGLVLAATAVTLVALA